MLEFFECQKDYKLLIYEVYLFSIHLKSEKSNLALAQSIKVKTV